MDTADLQQVMTAAFALTKLNLPSEAWDDIWQQAHDKSFIVAGAMKADLLADLRGAVDAAIEGRLTYQEFHKEFLNIAKAHGWINWTGSGSEAGQAWRTRIVYQTNMLTSHAAGRYRQLTNPAYLERFPYWVYRHRDGVQHPRPLHVSWDGLTLHHSHPFWRTHFPPNGWLCHCWVTSTDEAGFQKALLQGKGHPPEGWDALDGKTGAPLGIDKGWAYAPGANAQAEWRELLSNKLIQLDAPVGAAMWRELEPVVRQELAAAWANMVNTVLANGFSQGEMLVIGALKPQWVSRLEQEGVPPISAEIAARGDDVWHTLRDDKKGKLPLEWYADLPHHLASTPTAVILDQSQLGVTAILLIYGQTDGEKVVVLLDYKIKKAKSILNIVRSGKTLSSSDMDTIRNRLKAGVYTLIDGGL